MNTQKLNKAIKQSHFITIGEVQQYLIVRGANIENPILLLLHGWYIRNSSFCEV